LVVVLQEKASPCGPISQDTEIEPLVIELPCKTTTNANTLLKELPDFESVGM